ncbi:hypothetical protein [Paractinoplanes hotanensis]|uniref:Uncharacterized protein n=1 Tax=Paractinoplanes hotanensis TaxID=2906497 RepID=A0ABT0Y0S2_9ACTN|nr:hypothetical protein [Actinoplanes hotanensis]MCM4079621.1 hypothetical protein [Actinoplanes hotanensis]
MRRRALRAAFTASAAATATLGVRLATADAATEATTDTAAVNAAPATFTHPGVLVSRGQLDFVKTRISEDAQPWTAACNQMLASRLGIGMTNSRTYTESRRPQGTNNLFVAGETLTHANNPA